MQENDHLDAAEAEVSADQDDVAYGCVFCLTGKEQLLANRIEEACPGVCARTMRQVKYRTCKKVKTREESIAFPGYVFFRAPAETDIMAQFPRDNVIRLLMPEAKRWQLAGEDERFVEWLFQYDGLLGISQAYKEGDKIKIVSGPLKDMEGKIKRVDKRGCSGQVILSFYGKEIPVWLGFELIHAVK